MLKRIITAGIAIAILLPILFFSATIVFPIALAIILLISLYELFKCTGIHKKVELVLPLYVFGCAAPFLMRLLSPLRFAMIAFMAGAIYTLYLFALIIWSHGKKPFGETVAVYILAIYIIVALCAVLYVHDYQPYGKYIYLLIFLGAWITDSFAYFTGYFFGKHKLIEDVSPKKTIEGSIGGIFFCMLSFVVFGLIVDHCFAQHANLIFLAVCGIFLSVLSQIGDLIMSVIKRHYKLKDFGWIFPGHGGMLDRFDSILAVSLGMAIICMFVSLTGIQLM